MSKKDKKEKNKFNFVSQEELDKVSINLKDTGKSISSNEAFKDIKNVNSKKKTSDDAVVDVIVSFPKKKTSDDAIVDLARYSLSSNSLDGELYSFNYDKEELSLPFEVIVHDDNSFNSNDEEKVEIKEEKSKTSKEKSNVKEESVEDIETSEEEADVEEKLDEDIETSEEEADVEEELDEDIETSEEEADVEEELDEDIDNNTNQGINSNKNYERNIVIYIILILLMGIALGFFIYQIFQYRAMKNVDYIENSNLSYSVCDKGFNNKVTCLNDDIDYYSGAIGSIKLNFDYDVTFDEKIKNDYKYKVVASAKIVDQTDKTKVLYENEDLLFSKDINVKNDDMLEFNTNVDVNFEKYNQSVLEYNKKYNLNVSGILNVSLYLQDARESRSVASIELPLGGNTFKITKKLTNNANGYLLVKTTTWDNTNSLYAVLSIIFISLIIILFIRLFRMFFTVRNNRNEYQIRLSSILREYDRLIVIARDGYESNVSKKVIEVNTFDDLLKIRASLEKPIIFSNVNSNNSEFIVEDDEKLYKFVLKESKF